MMRALINGITMHWDDNGDGQPIVLIHGYPLNRSMWQPQIDALCCAGYRIISPDLRGFGDSEASDLPYTMDLFVDDLVALLDHLGICNVIFGGMSMGGCILMRLMERYPQKVSAACFIVTRSEADDPAGRERRLKLARQAMVSGPQAIATIFSELLFADRTKTDQPELFERIFKLMTANAPQGLAGGMIAMAGRKDYTRLLNEFRQPSLVIGAEEDKAVNLGQIETIAAGLANSSVCIIPRAGHMVNMEQPDAFNDCLIKFLKGLELS
jgi:pimeloyl-ACP methyl ester carboxylesterase